GNDGFNTVTPLDDGSTGTLRTAYDGARSPGDGGLRLAVSDLAPYAIGNDFNTGTPLAFHPGLRGLKHLYDLGKVAVIQGCGYPNYALSHEGSRIIFQTANPLGLANFPNGWLGRYLAANYTSTDVPGVTVQDVVAGELYQTATSVLALN